MHHHKYNLVYNQQKQKEDRSSGSPSEGIKIPEFNAEKYISPEKIKTLGISL